MTALLSPLSSLPTATPPPPPLAEARETSTSAASVAADAVIQGSAQPWAGFAVLAEAWDGAVDIGEAIGGVSSGLRLSELADGQPPADALRPLSSEERWTQALEGTLTLASAFAGAVLGPAAAAALDAVPVSLADR